MPVPAYNTFNEVFDCLDIEDFKSIVPLNTEHIRPEDFSITSWPEQPGDFHVLNAKRPIALALLQGVEIDRPKFPSINSNVAIIGSILTENLGVEHLIKNIIANPYLRHLVLCGEDIEGHLPGDALSKLFANGVDESKRIIGARGARPVLKNVAESEIQHFVRQIQLIDWIGDNSMPDLVGRLSKLDAKVDQPYETGLKVELVLIEKAKPANHLKLDPAGFFVINVMKGKKHPLLVEHYSNDGRLKNLISGKDSASICATLIEKKLISRLDHAAYVGREIVKAEMSLKSGSKYIQDRAQGMLC